MSRLSTASHPRTIRRPCTTRTAALAAATLTATLLTGCGGSEPEPEVEPEPSAGPLQSLFDEFLAEWSNEDVNRQLTQLDEAVAECMAEYGFTYTPVDYSALSVDFLGSDLGLEPETLEFAEQYGYGLTTDPWGVADLDTDALEDPNAEYVAAMSEAEQAAYHEALYGAGWDDADPEDDGPSFSWEPAGCLGTAQQQILLGESDDEDQFLALQQEMMTMMESAANDPRLDRANADWAVCMTDAGYPGLAGVGDAEAEIAAEVAAVRAAATSDDGAAPGLPGLLAPDSDVQEQLALITPREIDTAVADLTCRAEVGYDALRREVDHEYQRTFLAENQTEITEWLASLESSRG